MPYDDPVVFALVARLQEAYVAMYGGQDATPIAVDELRPPDGVFVVAYAAGAPVAMGGWRRHVEARSGRVPGQRPVEIKRMFVVPEARGRGLARLLLAELERLARADGADQMVLETGLAQPEAIGLYPVGRLRRHPRLRALRRQRPVGSPRQAAGLTRATRATHRRPPPGHLARHGPGGRRRGARTRGSVCVR